MPADTATAGQAICRALVHLSIDQREVRRIRLAWNLSETELVVSVRDDGPGAIDPESATVRQMTERVLIADGTLSLETVPSWGSTFTARFPLRPAQRETPCTAAGVAGAEPTRTRRAGTRGRRPTQPRHPHAPRHFREHRQIPCRQHPRRTRRTHTRRSRRTQPRSKPRLTDALRMRSTASARRSLVVIDHRNTHPRSSVRSRRFRAEPTRRSKGDESSWNITTFSDASATPGLSGSIRSRVAGTRSPCSSRDTHSFGGRGVRRRIDGIRAGGRVPRTID